MPEGRYGYEKERFDHDVSVCAGRRPFCTGNVHGTAAGMGHVPAGNSGRHSGACHFFDNRDCVAENGRKNAGTVNAKTIVAVCTGVFGALLFGIGMCLTMIFAKMILGIVIGLAGMIVLMMLIPLTKGLK